MKTTLEKLIIGGLIVFLLYFIVTMSYLMGTLQGHREAIEVLRGEEMPQSSAIRAAWDNYNKLK